jgi:hypothetical protein
LFGGAPKPLHVHPPSIHTFNAAIFYTHIPNRILSPSVAMYFSLLVAVGRSREVLEERRGQAELTIRPC